jgi:hypothetical protein
MKPRTNEIEAESCEASRRRRRAISESLEQEAGRDTMESLILAQDER